MKVDLLQNAFNAGEFSPTMKGRADLSSYASAVQTLENFLILPQGGIVRRSGSRFVKEVADSTVVERLVPFVFSTTQAYIIEFTDSALRFYMDEGAVLEAAININNVAVAAGVITVTTAGAHGYANGDEVYIEDVGGMIEINNRFFIVANQAGNTFELDGIDGTDYTAYTAGGTVARVYEIATTYTEAELPDLRFAQSADTLYIVHEDHPPAVLTRTAHTAWTLTDIVFIDGPYLEMRVPEVGDDMLATTITIDPAADTGAGVAITAGAPGFFDDPRDIDRIFRYIPDPPADPLAGGLIIKTVVNATTATCDIVSGDDPRESPPVLPGAAATAYWYAGAYYPGNYPRSIAFFEGRLAFAGTPLEPERLDASVTGAWDDFAPSDRGDDTGEPADDSGLSYQLGGANDVQIIRWLATIRNLVIGTTGGIWPVQASSTNEAVTPTNINMPRASAYGCAAIQPVTAFDTVIYVSRTGKKILAAGYSLDVDSYATQDLTIMADHVTGSGISFMEYQQEPHSVVWCLRSDGQLAGMTYERGQRVFGWHRHILGGVFGSGDPVIESIAVIPSPEEDHDQLWMIVKRTINGSTVRYVEFLEQDFADDDEIEDSFFVDCGYTYDGAATDTLVGLDYLEGETVTVLADGATHPDRTVTDGSITLNDEYSTVQLGYSFNSDCEGLPVVVSGRAGATAGKLLRPTKAYVRLHRTSGLKYGTDEDHLSILPFRSTSDAMDAPPPLFTGIKEMTLQHGSDQEAVLYLRQDLPLPAKILYVAMPLGISDR